ncbi:hypothetical protein P7H19_19370 [Paenibacillus larvae]|nr:hypothetical protein [Paenibacillus larvae]MDT2238006.1 hypothetical protein [Paenibacillus larvae]
MMQPGTNDAVKHDITSFHSIINQLPLITAFSFVGYPDEGSLKRILIVPLQEVSRAWSSVADIELLAA